MKLTGQHFIAGQRKANGDSTFTGVNPATGQKLPTVFHDATIAEIDQAATAAEEAFYTLQTVEGKKLAELLETIAAGIEGVGEVLVQQVQLETGLPEGRCRGELKRTCHQLGIFAAMAAEDSWRLPRIDVGDSERVFGPTSTIYRCQSKDQMLKFARSLDGHLTATLHGTEEDLKQHVDLVNILQHKVGRVVFNGFPTGIEICNAMHHGGPYPAATHSFFTSIGHQSIYRFVKPVCFQGFPESCLPEALR